MDTLSLVATGLLAVIVLAVLFFGVVIKNKKFKNTDCDSLLFFDDPDENRKTENYISDNRFYQLFQPIVNAETGKIAGCEALTRLKKDGSSDIMPNDFLVKVRDEKMYYKFDMFVFKKCCEQSKHFGKSIFITCNFSRQTLTSKNAVKSIMYIIEKTGASPDTLAIEITEDAAQSSNDTMYANIAALKKEGFKIYLDDFGKAYTSIEDLTRFTPDAVKTDKNILYSARTEQGRIVFEHIVKLAGEMNAAVLCKGIENAEQLAAAKDAGCSLLQGFYFYKPMTADELDKLL